MVVEEEDGSAVRCWVAAMAWFASAPRLATADSDTADVRGDAEEEAAAAAEEEEEARTARFDLNLSPPCFIVVCRGRAPLTRM